MGPLPRRSSLAEHTADILRQEIHRGRWRTTLPGEHQLSDELKVSRSTLRVALRALEKEGLLRTQRGSRRTLARSFKRHPHPVRPVVAMISSIPLHEQSSRAILVIDELRRHLHRHGLELHWQAAPQGKGRLNHRQLARLVEQTRAAGWILSSCSSELQRWFSDRALPTLVMGSCHRDIRLPYVRQDLAAACRHAVGRLHAAGHRRLILLMPPMEFAGSIEIEAGFRDATAARPASVADCRIIRHQGESKGVEKALRSALALNPRPTAAIVMMAEDALATHCHLLRHGFVTPAEFSLISILDDGFLRRTLPEITRYSIDQRKFARRVVRQVLTLTHRTSLPRSISIDPDYITGGTLGPAPA
jgi:DNA-binding LacI/PurR family transcriptional regulator